MKYPKFTAKTKINNKIAKNKKVIINITFLFF